MAGAVVTHRRGLGAPGVERESVKRLIAYVVGAIVATLVVGSISEQRLVRYENRESVIIFALVVGLVSAYIEPVLKLSLIHI